MPFAGIYGLAFVIGKCYLAVIRPPEHGDG